MTLLTTHDLFNVINEMLSCGGMEYKTNLNSLWISAAYTLRNLQNELQQ